MVIVGVGLSVNQESIVFEKKLLSENSDLVIIQGNSILANSSPVILEQPKIYAILYGKDPNCPIELQCVSYVKGKGLELPKGDAKDIKPNSDVPVVGGGVLLYSGRWGHIAYIEEVFENGILVSEANVEGCGVVSTRSISLDSLSIRGFIK